MTAPHKYCARCNCLLPWSDYYAAVRAPDGTMIRPGAYCKPCVAARKRQRRRDDPAWAKALDQKDWARIKADPHKLEHRRQLTRENLVVHRLRKAQAS